MRTGPASSALSALPGEAVALFDGDGRPLPLDGDAASQALAAEILARGPDLVAAALAGAATDLADVAAGEDRLYDVRIAPLRIDGDVAGAVAVARDVTAQRRAERELAHSERRYRELIENSSNVVMRAGADGRYTFVSRSAKRVFGWDPEQMLGRPVRDFLHPDDHERQGRMRQALRAGSPEEVIELRVPRPDGTFLWVESRCRALRDDDGTLTAVQTSARDISDRKAAEAARVAADEEFRTAFDDAAIGMALVAPDGSWLRVNDALCDLVGYPPHELMGMTFQDITHPDDCDADVALAGEVLRGERRTYQMEKRYLRADGSIVWVLLSVSLVRDAAGEPLHFISQIQDVSECKRLEAQLSRMATEDSLTGLRNRRCFENALHQQSARCGRYGEAAHVLLLDLDGFKAVNDTHGHHAGDALLRHVAGVMRERLRAGDVLARLGGDEFAALLPHAGAEAAAALAGELAARPLVHDGVALTASASVGVAAIDPVAGGEAALRAADRAMYAAKRDRGGAGRLS